MRNPIFVEHNGLTLSATEWATILGISASGMLKRIRHLNAGDLTPDECFSPEKQRNPITICIGNKTYTSQSLADEVGITLQAAAGRITHYKNGDIDEETLFHKGLIDKSTRKKAYRLADGTKVSKRDLANKANVNRSVITRMLNEGKTPQEIFDWANKKYRYIPGSYFIDGVKAPSPSVAESLGIKVGSLWARKEKRNWSVAEAATVIKMSLEESLIRANEEFHRQKHRREMVHFGALV